MMNQVEEEVEKDTITKDTPTSDMAAPMAGGFSTGRGKKVNVSEASIYTTVNLVP